MIIFLVGKSPFLVGKSTISTGHGFNSYVPFSGGYQKKQTLQAISPLGPGP